MGRDECTAHDGAQRSRRRLLAILGADGSSRSGVDSRQGGHARALVDTLAGGYPLNGAAAGSVAEQARQAELRRAHARGVEAESFQPAVGRCQFQILERGEAQLRDETSRHLGVNGRHLVQSSLG